MEIQGRYRGDMGEMQGRYGAVSDVQSAESEATKCLVRVRAQDRARVRRR